MIKNDLDISLEGVSDELVSAYSDFQLNRARQGRPGLDWAFQDRDCNTHPICVARRSGRIVGISANIPRKIKLGNNIGRAFQAVDSFVAEEARGQGLFTKLADAFGTAAQRSEVDVIWGFPNANAAPAWYGKLGWTNLGQVPFLVRPLRASFFLRKLRLPGDLPLARPKEIELREVTTFGEEVDGIWALFSRKIECAITRDATAMNHRIFGSPDRDAYRVVMSGEGTEAAIVISRIEQKHGARIAYILEAMGGALLAPLLRSEIGYLAHRGAEIALSWCFPWSPNFRSFRSAGFFVLPERLRPVEIHFGAKAYTPAGASALKRENWYLSYLDSDGV